MPLADIVTIEVGSAVVKAILQIWLKDPYAMADFSVNLLDIFKSKTSDRIAQHKAQRQFEAIGERIGESLVPLFESEGTRLDESERIEVAEVIAETFKKARISTTLLVKENLEPTKLAHHVQAAHPIATNHLNEAQTTLYHRIIRESCEYIVDIASQLPAFTEQSFGEILKREDRLLTVAEKVLAEIRQMREQLNPEIEAERFELAYRRAVIRNLDILELFGADISLANRRHRLSAAYIALSVTQSIPSYLHSILPVKQEEAGESGTIIAVDRVLTRADYILVYGPAGSGKTTLLQWLAVQSASHSFEGTLSDWNTTVPFYIRLRHYINLELPAPESFPRLVAPAIADTMPKGWVHAQLRTGRALVLIDGLDELSAVKRKKVQVWVRDLIKTFPNSRFIVTSRPHAIEAGWMGYENSTYAELQPMGRSDIDVFIDHWHTAVREELQEEEEKAELPSLAEHLKEAFKQDRSIRALANNPLLCSMLCALNRDRRKQLPADRIELYEACCQLLLERRDRERLIELSDYPILTYRQKRVLLENLAYWFTKNGWTEVKRQECDDRLTHKLLEMTDIPSNVNGADISRLFIERTGMLREPAIGLIDFTHRTFQEFLSAQAILDEGDFGVLIQNAHNHQWHEIIILACGLAPKRVREDLLQELMKRAEDDPNYRNQIYLLTVACLEASIDLSETMRDRIMAHYDELVFAKRTQDARSLASAGDIAIPFLLKGRQNDSSSIVTCINTLALIGSEASLDALEEYARDASNAACDALFRAWDFYERKSYAQRVLSLALRESYKVKVKRLPSLEGFHYFSQLTSLDLSECERISDLTPLVGLTRLTSLNLLMCMQITDLTPLAGLIHLTSLNLLMCTRISDLTPLAGLTRLTSLNLGSCWQISDLSPLANLKQLASLNLSSCGKVRDLRPLAGLNKLKVLISRDIANRAFVPEGIKMVIY